MFLTKWHLPLAVSIGLAILVIAAIETASLVWLRKMPQRRVDFAAAANLSERGAKFVHFLANRHEVRGTGNCQPDWNRLHYYVDTLDATQTGLQYVKVERNGETVFSHEPGKSWQEGIPAELPRGLGWLNDKSIITHSRGTLRIDGRDVAIMVFSQEFPAADGAQMRVEVALRRDASDEIREPAVKGILTMFYIAVGATVAAFSACIVVMIWAIIRDSRRERSRRQEEHLAFSGMMANGIVHDFRNPMSAVRLDAQMLEREVRRPEGPRCERMSELASRIGHTMDRMDNVMNEFLFLARPDSGKLERVDLREIITDRFEALVPRLEAAGIDCIVTFNGEERAHFADGKLSMKENGAPLFVSVMKNSFRRALSNVVLNATQFSPKGGVVEIAADEHEHCVRIEVRDRGPGIPPRERDRIFDIFNSSRPGGTGLGLFIAHTAVTQSGGTISALPRKGGGTIIRIELPRGS